MAAGENPQIDYYNNGTISSFNYEGKRYIALATRADFDEGDPYYALEEKYREFKADDDKVLRKEKLY